MKNLKVGKKLFLSYASILVLLVLGSIVSLVNIINMGNQVETFYQGPFIVKSAASTINATFEEMQKSVFRSISTTDQSVVKESIQNAKNCATIIQEQIPIVKDNFLGDIEIVTRLEAKLSELAPMREKVLEFAEENRNAEAADYMEKNNIIVIKEAQKELDLLIETANQNGEEMILALQRAQEHSTIMLIILGIASIVVSTLFGLYITKSLTSPISELETAAEKLAEGDLNAVITYDAEDELGGLAKSMRVTIARLSEIIQDISSLLAEIADGNFDITTQKESVYVGSFHPLLLSIRQMDFNLSSTLKQINQSADQVSAGSEQVASASQALSQGAAEQASSVEELAATITEISQQIKNTTDNASQANQKADSVGMEAEESNRRMQEMLTAMSEISETSGQIGRIIKTIEDIAFQTNILALNAAVEAARAGAAGKGFAVVADEVRNLASKSAEASKNTAALIEGSLKAVENGTKIADETAQSLHTVVAGVKEVTGTIEDIFEDSKRQAKSMTQITTGIDQISSVVQTNSATAEESAAASEELSGQAQILKTLVSQFKLKEGKSTQSSESKNDLNWVEPAPALSLNQKY